MTVLIFSDKNIVSFYLVLFIICLIRFFESFYINYITYNLQYLEPQILKSVAKTWQRVYKIQHLIIFVSLLFPPKDSGLSS